MKTFGVEQFLELLEKELIPQWSQEPTCALFTTYNTVRGYESGELKTSKNNLSIRVENGNMPHTIDQLLGLSMSLVQHPIAQEIAKNTADKLGTLGAGAQKRVARHTKKILHEKISARNIIVFAYVGVSAFRGAIEFIEIVREQNPDIAIVALSCDCNNPRDFLPHSKAIDFLIFTRHCGGREDMKLLLEKLRSSWPSN